MKKPLLIVMVLALIALSSCGNNYPESEESATLPDSAELQEENPNIDSQPTPKPKIVPTISGSTTEGVEIIAHSFSTDKDVLSPYFVLEATNNTGRDIKIAARYKLTPPEGEQFVDEANGLEVVYFEDYVACVEDGKTAILKAMGNTLLNIGHCEYEIIVRDSEAISAANKINVTKEDGGFFAENISDKTLKAVEIDILFFKDDKLVDLCTLYFDDIYGEIQVGETIGPRRIHTYNFYDEYRYVIEAYEKEGYNYSTIEEWYQ